MNNIVPLRYIGDLSEKDVDILAKYSYGKKVLEFGIGGSTQIFSQVSKDIVSVETDDKWINLTENKLKALGTSEKVQIVRYAEFAEKYFGNRDIFDVVFIDNHRPLRLESALRAWGLLSAGGHMIFHDTRYYVDIQNVSSVFLKHFLEIRTVSANDNDSNMTVLEKGNLLKYQNWQKKEGKPRWRYGRNPEKIPKDFWTNSRYEYRRQE